MTNNSVYSYGILKKDIHTWDMSTMEWVKIAKGTKGVIKESMLVPLSRSYDLVFNAINKNGEEFRAVECVNERDLELVG